MYDTEMITKNRNTILKEIEEYRKKDFTYKSGHILGSMCTQPYPIAKQAYMKFLETNLGDPELFPGTKEIEKKYIKFVLKLLNAPKTSDAIIGSGGTESNITAIWLAKKITGKKEIIIPENSHFSFEKIASLMDIKTVSIPLNKNYYVDIKKLEKKITNKTAAVVGIAGSTELGTIDPLPKISEICFDENIFLHVDAAFGGYVIPFLKQVGYNLPDFDFKLKGVSSISIDAHKMGCSAIPIGSLAIRDKKWLDEISVEAHCVSSGNQSGILGTRSGGPVAAAWAVSENLGIKGYKKIAQECMNTTNYLVKLIDEIGLQIIVKPTMNVVGIRVKRPSEIIKKLTKHGWKLNKMDRISCLRIVVMPHVTKRIIDEFIPDLEKICKDVGEI